MAEQMKPSGIEWIGDIPNEWGITKVRFVTKLRSEQGFYSSDDKYIGLENISSYTGEYISTESEYDADTYDLYKAGDLLFSKLRPYLAKALIADDYGFCTGELAVIKEYNGDIRYLFYYMLSDGFLKMVDASTYGAKMPRASWDYIKNLQIPVMRKSEQQTIADFLDKECAQIDSIVVDLEKQIALLQQYKKSLITETVTKGLDKSVPMKDSGNPIIGSINYWYATKKLKYIVATPITDGPHETPVLVDDGIPFLSAESVKNGILDFEYKRGYISESDHKFFCKKIKPQKNDVFIVKSGATTGNVGIVTVDQEFSIWSPLALIRCDDKTVLQKFIYYCVSSNYFKHEIEQAWSYGTQQNIGMGVVENLTVVIPPVDEQKKIVHYLDDVLASMDKMIIDKTKQLEIIQQHKKSLIYEYVTGKKRVKEVR